MNKKSPISQMLAHNRMYPLPMVKIVKKYQNDANIKENLYPVSKVLQSDIHNFPLTCGTSNSKN